MGLDPVESSILAVPIGAVRLDTVLWARNVLCIRRFSQRELCPLLRTCIYTCAFSDEPIFSISMVQCVMSERRQPYGYRPIGQAPRVLTESLPERERERARKQRQNQRSMKSYKVGGRDLEVINQNMSRAGPYY